MNITIHRVASIEMSLMTFPADDRLPAIYTKTLHIEDDKGERHEFIFFANAEDKLKIK